MFNIESTHGDLVDLLRGQTGLVPAPEISDGLETIGSDMDSITDTLSTMYFQLKDIADACVDGTLASEFPYVQGIGDLDDKAEEVVRELMTELATNLMTSIRDLTRFDRVDRR